MPRPRVACAPHALHVIHMPKMIQIRNVPDRLHKALAARAAAAGMSLSDYAKQELEESARKLTWQEITEHVASLPPIEFSEDPVEILRKARDER